ncbi:dihydrodipicolinate synthase family protein [Tessaracoccus sp. SD287]|uniref:dihydrodipicolinate synthase family protein n=1 Tax=Tessaracoccus sp. SD287 TaxID=2782008 RepID=UPI001A968965|nr:dihydrodipicolinate synthase family protein [Tessaracoccus sp. SD287]
MSLLLPGRDGSRHRFSFTGAPAWLPPAEGFSSRVAFAAAHAIPRVEADNVPGRPADIDWDATLAFRHHLWSHGFGVAEAMDTAQRGMGLDWDACQQLIRRSSAEAVAGGHRIATGVGTDHLPPGASLGQVVDGYLTQLEVTLQAGAQPIVMASRHLAAVASGPEDYVRVYARVLAASDRPVILHWLGTMFDPALAGYWGSSDLDVATETFVDLVTAHADRVDGVKVSLLDADHEVSLRRRLPAGVRLYTGDDFNYAELIRGDGQLHSDALLGAFAAIAGPAAAALAALDAGDLQRYDQVMGATVPLSRQVFAAPTFHYKTGIAFVAWLTGHQRGFQMVNGQHAGRSIVDLAETARLADAAGIIHDVDLAERRLGALLTVAGVDQ